MKLLTSIVLLTLFWVVNPVVASNAQQTQVQSIQDVEQKYLAIGLEGIIEPELFAEAYQAYLDTGDRKKPLLTIIDYKRPSTEERFFVIDLENNQLLHRELVAHGVNSGVETATAFSNVMSSRKTSLGVFLTDETYYGNNGYSLRLDGLSEGMNDNARDRAIVVHGASYATEDFIERNGYLGRSWGCPALSPEVTREIIDLIKGGSVIYASA